jgi:hypothetical protein
MPMFKSRTAGLFLLLLMCGTSLSAQLYDSQNFARDVFKELIEINTPHSVGNTVHGCARHGQASAEWWFRQF